MFDFKDVIDLWRPNQFPSGYNKGPSANLRQCLVAFDEDENGAGDVSG